ncbi:putative paraflagellar rod component [Leishmania mexicana MHOM/GT/2001/U1103]|uniref:Paraflagellar rod component n=1 Tax=Leishmania mexicana (strain MHOM/GT/2001/U1103) TaxID=929439 RepID=E9AMY4_LEIMU|nr:putative paraflagellar rod component [Leishmania mexicana MHOM/GT/2001/U1103]CBZ24289.1 putative paraflagellar rod component [Leishmania mexicana MHOM/GT/2001/U1103]
MSSSAIVLPTYPSRDVQNVENHRCIAAIAELAENGLTIADNFVTYTEGRLSSLALNGERILEAAAKLHERYRHERPAGWDEARFMGECEQRVTPEEIEDLCTLPALDANAFANALCQLTNKDLPRGRYLVVKDSLSVIKPHVPKTSVIDLSETLAALHDIQHVDPTAEIKDELSEMDEQQHKYVTKVDEAQAVYDTALSHGDVVEVERAHRHLIAARYEYLVSYVKRLHFLSSTEEDSEVVHFADRLQKLREDADDAVKAFSDHKHAIKSAVRADLERCQESRAREAATHEAAKTAFQNQKRKMEASLGSVVEHKVQLVNEILEKAAELRRVMEQQRVMTQDVVEAVKEEAKRVTAYEEFVTIGDQHLQRLRRCLEYCNGCEPVIREMEKYVKTMVEKLPHEDAEKALNAIIDHESDELLKVYRAFVFVCGELTVKKTHRLDTLERQARLAQHNRDSSMDSLDPNFKHYCEEVAEMLAQAQAVEGVINALHATQDAGEQVFESVEELVLASCERTEKPFVHPLQELGYESVAARTRFVNRSMKYVEGEEHEIFQKKARIAEAKALVEQEQEALVRGVSAAAIAAPAAVSLNAADGAVPAPAQIEA